jgi:hypothetical protein
MDQPEQQVWLPKEVSDVDTISNELGRNWVAVLGGATKYDQRQITAAFEIGRQIALRRMNVVTGGTSGVPYAAAIGAKMAGGLVVGISPAISEREHAVRFRKPVDYVDLMVYSGMDVDGRSPLIIRSASAAIFIGGEFGTLNEFTSAWMNGTGVIGILEGFGGISDSFRELLNKTRSSYGSAVVFASDPISLVRDLCLEVSQRDQNRVKVTSGCNGIDDVKEMISDYLESQAAPC